MRTNLNTTTMKRYTFGLLLTASLYPLNCDAQQVGNVLVIVADDLGREMLSFYDSPTAKRAKTPNLDRLAKQGVVFDNCWGYPLSAPVRAAMLTGRYGHHTGVVALEIDLPKSEETLFEALPESYSNALIGKWHLSKYDDFAPDYGIDYFAGIAQEGGVRNYFRWMFTENGRSTFTTEYATTKLTDSAIKWIERQESPWFCWVAYNSPHLPYHLPPSHMHSQKRLKDSQDAIDSDHFPYFLAMIESLDYDIGRLLKNVDDNTTIIFVGDNGTANDVLQSPYPLRHGKGTLYEAGVGIPMIVTGRGVKGSGVRSDALVSAVDIFPTVMELAGKELPKYEDGYSFLGVIKGESSGLRDYNFSEILHPRFGYMNSVSDGRYKIITPRDGTSQLYDLKSDPLEQYDLAKGSLSGEVKQRYDALIAELERLKIPLDSIPENAPQSDHMNRRGGAGGGNRDGMRTQMGSGNRMGTRGGGNSYNNNNSFNNSGNNFNNGGSRR